MSDVSPTAKTTSIVRQEKRQPVLRTVAALLADDDLADGQCTPLDLVTHSQSAAATTAAARRRRKRSRLQAHTLRADVLPEHWLVAQVPATAGRNRAYASDTRCENYCPACGLAGYSILKPLD